MSMKLNGEWNVTTTARDQIIARRVGGLEKRQPPLGALSGFQFGARLGDIGDVYEGHNRDLPDPFVIKLLGYLTEDRSEAVAAFSREASVMAALHHPNIVQVLASGVLDSRTPFVAMERLRGRTLEEHLNLRHPLPLSLLLPVLRGIVSALLAAHENGVVHREMRPDNVFLVDPTDGKAGSVKVLDFGVSRLTSSNDAVHRGISADDACYLAPEQRAGSSTEVGPKADQFAVAALVCRILRGATPLPCNPVVRQSGHETHTASASTTPGVRRTSEVKAVLLRALNEDPRNRYASVASFLASLENALLIAGSVPHHRAAEDQQSDRHITLIGRVLQEGAPQKQKPREDLPFPEAPGDAAMALPSFSRSARRQTSLAVVAMIAVCVIGSVAAWGVGLGVLRAPTTGQLAAPMAASDLDTGASHLVAPVSPASKR